MKKVVYLMLFVTHFTFSQENKKIETYNFGHNSMELVAHSKKGTVIVSTFNSKMTIRQDIASKVYDLFLNDKLINNSKITIVGNDANVTGKCIIRKKNNLIVVDFYYETVEWYTGLKEIYKKKIG